MGVALGRMRDDPKYVHCPVLTVDIEGYSRRSHKAHAEIRSKLKTLLDGALSSVLAGSVSAAVKYTENDTGDGFILGFPSNVQPLGLFRDVVPAIQRELKAHNYCFKPEFQIRLRIVIHCGPAFVDRNGKGFTGHAVIRACDLLDSKALKRALKNQGGDPIVLMVSDDYYRSIIQQEAPEHADEFRRLPVKTSKRGSAVGWLWDPHTSARLRLHGDQLNDSKPGFDLAVSGPNRTPELADWGQGSGRQPSVRLKELEAKAGKFEQTLATRDRAIAERDSTIAAHNSAIATLKGELATLRDAYESLKKAYAELKEAYEKRVVESAVTLVEVVTTLKQK